MRKCRAVIWVEKKQVPVEGFFHQWASQFEDCGDAGIGNYTVAIIELEDGRIVEAAPDTVVFSEPTCQQPVWWMRNPTTVGISCENCGRACKKTYPFSSHACPSWISREGMLRASGTATEEQKPGELGE